MKTWQLKSFTDYALTDHILYYMDCAAIMITYETHENKLHREQRDGEI
jgi:hypothetical protein